MVRPEDGELAVRLVRETVSAGLAQPGTDPAQRLKTRDLPTLFDEPRGVFVTLRRYPSGALRGCIGFPLPVYPLRIALPRAAWGAAVDDPRFPPVQAEEFAAVTGEVSLLTVPESVDVEPRERLPRFIVVGRDGLIVERGGSSGLLLPQVAIEQGWSAEELLRGTCEKAGLRSDAWRSPGTTVRRFSAEVFLETSPGGPVEQEALRPGGPH